MKNRWNLILPANALLLCLGLADLASTLWWVKIGRAIEINPVMAAVLKAGVPAFVAVKLTSLAAYVSVVEWYRRRHDACRARAIGLFTAIAYAAIYSFSFVLVNHRFLLG